MVGVAETELTVARPAATAVESGLRAEDVGAEALPTVEAEADVVMVVTSVTSVISDKTDGESDMINEERLENLEKVFAQNGRWTVACCTSEDD